ncbi:hypothetical protein MRB53_035337 [Persea americana]|uniref:Uncharacterized protein n=1 Tax=Persea americana TaxID=3435 RepID=A0ACC2K4C9_PERAE|nr:hypothetical protein MRB53_035337 [Persea americana]
MPPATRITTLLVCDAESLFRSKPVLEIRSLESATKREIESPKEELRLLVGNRYRDLIESADSILLIKSSSQSISSNLSAIDSSLRSLSSFPVETLNPNPNSVRSLNYAIATRVKYLVDTPESIWGCLDGSLFLEASGRYLRAKVVRGTVGGDSILNSPLLGHHWQIVKGFKG